MATAPQDSAAPPPDLAHECAREIAAEFVRYNAEFRAITRRAPVRFDTRDHKASQRDAVERIELYDRFVNRIVAALRTQLGQQALDRKLWEQIKDGFPTEIQTLPDPQRAKT